MFHNRTFVSTPGVVCDLDPSELEPEGSEVRSHDTVLESSDV